MANQPVADITELTVLGDEFPVHLMQLGFRLMQVMDEAGRDQFRYVIPPVCAVPAGPFLMGSNQQRDPHAEENELPQHMVLLPAYHIGTYPLTVAEYACFVEATQQGEPEDWDYQQRYLDHPVVNVSWNDVLTYANFLAQVTGEPWRLPTEAEWEKAARGLDGRIFPWGDVWDETRANSEGGGPGMTTPVGTYPDGVSPYGCYDMAGNVFELTSITDWSHPHQTNDGREDLNNRTRKVIRGGSWYDDPWDARAAYRPTISPRHPTYNTGGRLVRGDVAG